MSTLGWIAVGFSVIFAISPASAEKIRMATMSPAGAPSRFVYDQLMENIEAQTEGRYTIEPYFNGELGPEESYFNAMRRGRIQLSAISSQAVGTAVPEYAVLRAPYLFSSFEELAFVYDGFLSSYLTEKFDDKGMVHIQWAANGWENVYAQKPVLSPVNVEGYRIRIPLEPNAALFFAAAGADVIQIPFTDIIQSLQTGLIEGGESTTLMYVQAGIFTEARHFTRTRHGFSLAVFAANKRWFDRLPESAQSAIRSAYMPAQEAYPALHAGTQEFLQKAANQYDIVIHDLNPKQRLEWRNATRDAVEQIISQVGGDAEEVYALILEGKEAYAQTKPTSDTN